MKVLWLTGRSFDDLCSTTQMELAKGLCEKGHLITMVNGDSTSVSDIPWEHHALNIKALKGTKTRRLGVACAHHVQTMPPNSTDVAIVEWRLLPYIVEELKKKNVPWALMDRSPPANHGILARLQWHGWKKAWKSAKKYEAPGFVVSPAHAKFVNRVIGKDDAVVIPAGVNLERFRPRKRRTTLTMVYHGRLDQNRGVLALPMLAQKARSEGVEVDLILIGKGDAWIALNKIAENYAFIELRESVSNLELAAILSECHVGLLPMPDQKIWRLASPLKRSEYLASGLVVFGIDHSGHRVSNIVAPYVQLCHQTEFHTQGCSLLRKLAEESEYLSLQARLYAEEHLSWGNSVEIIEETLLSLTAD
jgi:glycosyltransferase involved in cell wall biosynthesis